MSLMVVMVKIMTKNIDDSDENDDDNIDDDDSVDRKNDSNYIGDLLSGRYSKCKTFPRSSH